MAKNKKKKSPDKLHRQVQDSLQALPYAIDDQKKKGRPVKALMLRYFTGPMLKVMKRVLDARRYRGEDGEKKRQTDQMRRRLEQKQAALRHLREHTPKQRRGRPM